MTRTFLAVHATCGVDLVNGHLDAVVGRATERGFAAGHRGVMAKEDLAALGFAAGCIAAACSSRFLCLIRNHSY